MDDVFRPFVGRFPESLWCRISSNIDTPVVLTQAFLLCIISDVFGVRVDWQVKFALTM
ncbi:hypothetical protein PAXRUDRAFT_832133 [Paxillus rubicundulus Ve08.2h10]|uniref:Uncharacterized protein n=1 Tax=Paxillus rubicundulus Ve08.2h10 TaxID=930991 RepID=A0A0D0CJA4_9AGAM|nr:hypothetical protein PAXRUDRAFT_832133 [Paxillus rubicundulus Ve08.2h10]